MSCAMIHLSAFSNCQAISGTVITDPYQASLMTATDQTRNRKRRRKSVSGAPAWATLAGGLKRRMIMIPLPNKSTAARVASGACCGGRRCRRVSGGQPDRSYILPLGITGITCADNKSLMHR